MRAKDGLLDVSTDAILHRMHSYSHCVQLQWAISEQLGDVIAALPNARIRPIRE